MLGVTEVILKMCNLFLCYHQKYCFNCGLMKGGQKKKRLDILCDIGFVPGEISM